METAWSVTVDDEDADEEDV
jgi:hypothetical protein